MNVLTPAIELYDKFYRQQGRRGKLCLDIKLQETLKYYPKDLAKAAIVLCIGGEWDAFKLGKLPQPEQKPEETHWTQTIDDGLGHYWNATCPKCEQPTMYVVRPGVARCSECDG